MKEHDNERLRGIERILLDPDILVQLALALKEERGLRVAAETRLKQVLEEKNQTQTSVIQDNTIRKTKDGERQGGNNVEKMYSPQEAADKLGVCRKTVLRRIEDGIIPAKRVGTRDLRIKASDLDKYINDTDYDKLGD